ncbi:MAG: dTDP-4-dehydrorhamnose 3,5-epimerase [Clostridia bacterium]|nr:dTDP-4-dehydrorhamnose 3,5-epimerase [Clostridia bacterium]
MKRIETGLVDCILVEPQVFGDSRGWFYESYSAPKLKELGISCSFVQDNRSMSALKGTLRGLHCQTEPCAQAKLISCTKGSITDVVVDIREGSPTYMKHFAVNLSEENKLMLFVPRGFLHGFVTLTDNVEVYYKTDNTYSPEHDRSVRYDDPSFGIDWNVENPILSAKDSSNALLCDTDIHFVY